MAGDPTDNAFRALGLHPRLSPEEITEALRELAEDADPEQRRRLQGLWRELTLHPEDRLRAALFAHTHPRRDLQRLDSRPAHELAGHYRLRARLPEAPPVLEQAPSAEALVVLPAPGVLAHNEDTRWPSVEASRDALLKL